MGWISFTVGTLLGNVMGVVLMCLLQINRQYDDQHRED